MGRKKLEFTYLKFTSTRLLALLIVMLVSFFTSCGQKEPSKMSVEGTTETIKIKFATWDIESAFSVPHYRWFAEELDKRTGGRVKMQIFLAASLGSTPELPENLQKGIADMAVFVPTHVPGLMPVAELMSVPLLIPTAPVMDYIGWHLISEGLLNLPEVKILAIMGSYRKGKTIDTLIDKAIEGAKANNDTVEVEKISLIDQNIEYCRGCMTRFRDDSSKEVAKCVIRDDMDILNPKILEADAYIFGTPVFMAHETAIMKNFLERICWVFAKPTPKRLKLVIPKGCPVSRSNREKKAIIITSSGIIKPRWKKYCDDATPLIKQTIKDSLNAKVVGTLYAGAIMKYGAEKYYNKAYELGKQLTS